MKKILSAKKSLGMKMKKIVRVGSRDSALAVAQTRLVVDAIARAYPEIYIELVTMKTTGDLNPQIPFDQTLLSTKNPQDRFGVKGLFIKELEQALLDGRIDLAVHSLKDMPMEQDERLPLCAFFKRGDPRDALVLPSGAFSLEGLNGAEGDAGCSSARRRVQLARLMPERRVKPIRGNVLSRLKKLDDGEYAFLVLAAAGLQRLCLGNRIAKVFTPEEMIPAAGQGVLVCQGRSQEDYGYLDAVRDADAEDCVRAERAFVTLLGGGCTLPVAAYAEVRGSELSLAGLYVDEAQGIYRKGTLSGSRKDAVNLGEALASQLKVNR